MEGHGRNIFIPSRARKTGCCHFATSGKFIFNRIESASYKTCGRALQRLACRIEIEYGEIESALANPCLTPPLVRPLQPLVIAFNFWWSPFPPPCNRLVRRRRRRRFRREISFVPFPLASATNRCTVSFRDNSVGGPTSCFSSLSGREIRDDEIINSSHQIYSIPLRFYFISDRDRIETKSKLKLRIKLLG